MPKLNDGKPGAVMNAAELCRACASSTSFKFEGRLLHRRVCYFECARCGYLQTETPTWLDEAYASPINMADTGILARNVLNTRRVGAFCLLLGKRKARIVDFAGGHGIQVRMLRDAGFDARWADKFCENLFARGFEHHGETADIATAFEAFEHFVEPGVELARMLDAAPTVLFSTLILPVPVPNPGSWWYYGEEHGQHIGLYKQRTLEVLAQQNSAKLYTNGSDLHVITKEPIRVDFRRLSIVMRLWPLVRRFLLQPLTHDDHAAVVGQFAAEGSKGRRAG